MLFIQVGVTGDFGYHCNKVCESKKLTRLKKWYYVGEKIPSSFRDPHNIKPLVKKDFFGHSENEDYEYYINGMHIGFAEADVMDAVSGNKDYYATITCLDANFFMRMKRAYGDQVRVVYTYIDKAAMTLLLSERKELKEEDKSLRMQTRDALEEMYKTRPEIFDGAILFSYKGDRDYTSVDKQLEEQIDRAFECQKSFADANYVKRPYTGNEPYLFVSYSHDDSKEEVNDFLRSLQMHGYRVWYDVAPMEDDDNWYKTINAKIVNPKCEAFIALLSQSYIESENCIDEIKLANGNSKKIVLVSLDGKTKSFPSENMRKRMFGRDAHSLKDENGNSVLSEEIHRISAALPSSANAKQAKG